MGVDIEKHLRSTVAESVLGVLDADAIFGEPTGMVMPEFMKGDREIRLLGDLLKSFGPVARVLKFTVRIGKYRIVVSPSFFVSPDK